MDAILRFGMDYGHRNALQQSQGHKTLLVVPEAVVFKREGSTVEYPPGIHKIQPMVLQVPLALNLVPCEPHRLVYMPRVYTSRRSNCCRLTTALAIVATVGNAREFKNGRQFAAWAGLVPGQYSTGGKSRLGHISKRGDAYLRNLLVQGARSVLQTAPTHQDRLSRRALELQARRGYYRTLVAIANKNARIAWALLARDQELKAVYLCILSLLQELTLGKERRANRPQRSVARSEGRANSCAYCAKSLLI